MGLVEDLNRISAMQGKAPIDPSVIQGQGDWKPPAIDPDVPPEWLDPEIDLNQPAPDFAAPPSPLIPRRSPTHPKPELPQKDPGAFGEELLHLQRLVDAGTCTAAMPTFSLCVADRLASWKKRDVTLLESEEKAIRAIVLKAIRREVDDDLGAVGEKPRRTRKPKAIPESFAAGNLPARRKPGRPRKDAPK